MLDLQRLRLLRELSRRGTVTAVAQALSFSPSAVSQQLATLEREAGVALLERVGRRVRLTPQGEILVEHADVLLREMERAESALARSVDDVSGTLRVAAFQTAVMSLLPPALVDLAARHPRLRVEVTELEPPDALPALTAGDLDVVVGEEYPGHPLTPTPGTARTDLGTDELLLVVPAGSGHRELRSLAEHVFVLEPEGSGARVWAVERCREAGFEPDVRFTTTDLSLHLTYVEAGLACALVPALALPGDRTVDVHRLRDRPVRRLLSLVRAGSGGRPDIEAFHGAVRAGGILGS